MYPAWPSHNNGFFSLLGPKMLTFTEKNPYRFHKKFYFSSRGHRISIRVQSIVLTALEKYAYSTEINFNLRSYISSRKFNIVLFQASNGLRYALNKAPARPSRYLKQVFTYLLKRIRGIIVAHNLTQ